jgi:hypothetical protein
LNEMSITKTYLSIHYRKQGKEFGPEAHTLALIGRHS